MHQVIETSVTVTLKVQARVDRAANGSFLLQSAVIPADDQYGSPTGTYMLPKTIREQITNALTVAALTALDTSS